MITRIVKLHFREDKIDEFLAFFEGIKWKVAKQEDCFGMKLMQDKNCPEIVFTYSLWKDEKALNSYRDSELFGQHVWPTIKPWFKEKAEAWTVSEYFDGFVRMEN
ncbi:MAG: Antibiotic biosynthesis monooxygenase [Crocinitomicaceae bacterium]|jgi:quinol monooxygenase YgiN|nr:Antibiotic biosynthesis monooxygenase [Crocinitomicaceae bacterium]